MIGRVETYYISSTPYEKGCYGEPKLDPFPGALKLPACLLDFYLKCFGYVKIIDDDGCVMAIARNSDAYNQFVGNLFPPEHPMRPAFYRCGAVDENENHF